MSAFDAIVRSLRDAPAWAEIGVYVALSVAAALLLSYMLDKVLAVFDLSVIHQRGQNDAEL